MNYYPHHIGDYLRDTSHLSLMEHGAYRRLLDLYYASERPLPIDGVYRLVRAVTRQEKIAVDVVLREYFQKQSDGWHNKRADREISKSQEKSGKAKASAAHRWQCERNADAMRTHSEGNAPNNQEPITNNQEPKSRERSRGSRLPSDWQPSEILKAWAVKERPDLNADLTVEKFKDYWKSVPGSKGCKLDWEATFRNFVRSERATKQTQAAPDYSEVIANLKD